MIFFFGFTVDHYCSTKLPLPLSPSVHLSFVPNPGNKNAQGNFETRGQSMRRQHNLRLAGFGSDIYRLHAAKKKYIT